MHCPFVVNQKVVCVAKAWFTLDGDLGPIQIKHGEICTIGAVDIPGEFNEVCIRLKEHGTHWFTASGFRPLHNHPKEADTDISVFYPLLKVTGPWGAPDPEPSKVPELEPADRGCKQ